MSRLVIIGSSNMDLTVKVKQIPLRGETVMAGDIVSAYGGKGANQAVAAKRFGSEAIFISKLGNDSYGTAIKKHFEDTDIADDESMEILALVLALSMKADMEKYLASRLLDEYFVKPSAEKGVKINKLMKSKLDDKSQKPKQREK
jgi:hypothetical protein